MSDAPQGPGWWLASDGRWYPPESAPAAAPPSFQQAPSYPPPAQGFGAVAPPTNSNATVSLVLGLVSLVMCGLFAGIPAIIVGSKARKQIRASKGTQGGDGLALAGLVLGWIGTALSALGIGLVALLIIFGSARSHRVEINSDPSDGYCDYDRYVQDPDC